MLEQILILSAEREYAAMFRQHLTLTIAAEARIDVETDPLRAMQLSPEHYNLILLDAMIGQMDGFQWMQLMKRQSPQTRFVVISEDPSELFRFQAYQNGADLFLQRPVSETDWNAAMSEIARVTKSAELDTSLATAATQSLPLKELITTHCGERNSVDIQVDIIGNSGDVFIYQGEIYHAQCSGFSGEQALRQILTWSNEQIRTQVHPLHSLPPRTIESPVSTLLGSENGAASGSQLTAPPSEPSQPILPLESDYTVTPLDLPATIKQSAAEAVHDTPPLDEEPPDFETPYKLETPPGETYSAPGLDSHWQIDLMGHYTGGSNVTDPEHAAALTFFIYRKMAQVAVALDENYFDHLTLIGPKYRQELVADNLCVRHAVFKNQSANGVEAEKFVSWCYERNL
jgi:DNA-binding NarL/FixJ family response regulator